MRKAQVGRLSLESTVETKALKNKDKRGTGLDQTGPAKQVCAGYQAGCTATQEDEDTSTWAMDNTRHSMGTTDGTATPTPRPSPRSGRFMTESPRALRSPRKKGEQRSSRASRNIRDYILKGPPVYLSDYYFEIQIEVFKDFGGCYQNCHSFSFCYCVPGRRLPSAVENTINFHFTSESCINCHGAALTEDIF